MIKKERVIEMIKKERKIRLSLSKVMIRKLIISKGKSN